MTGLLHLLSVPRYDGTEQPAVVRPLRAAIRDAAKEGRDRNIPLEEYYEQCLSWYEPREMVYFVRIAPIDSKGKPFGPTSTLILLKQCVVYNLANRFDVLQGHCTRYDHYYNAEAFDGTDFLCVPDNDFSSTIVALKRFKI